MPRVSRGVATLAGVALLGLLPLAVAHGGHDEDMDMDMNMNPPAVPAGSDSAGADPVTYFRYGGHSALMFAHILLMTVGWVFVLPVGEFPPKVLVFTIVFTLFWKDKYEEM